MANSNLPRRIIKETQCLLSEPVWEIYDGGDDNNMPRSYCVLSEAVSVSPFKVWISWLDYESEKLISWMKNSSCGRFRVSEEKALIEPVKLTTLRISAKDLDCWIGMNGLCIDMSLEVPVALVGESGNFASWLYIAAVKMNSLEKIESDLSELVEAMKTSSTFLQFTKDPSVPRETRLAAIVDVCDKVKFAEPTKNFLSLLAENGKLKNLDVIVKKFMQLTTAHRGDVKVLVTTVMPLPPAEEKELKETLQEITGEGKKVTVEQKVYRM
ncbi:hypothetical protein Bca4012_025406 [Brassica carinata]